MSIQEFLSAAEAPAPHTGNSETTLRAAFFESFTDPVLLCDRELVVLAANRAAAELLGKTADKLINRRADALLPRRSPPEKPIPTDGHLSWWSELGLPGNRCILEVSGLSLNDPALAAQGWALTLRKVGNGRLPLDFIGGSLVVQELLEFVSRIAASSATSILVLGESGTGKELIARRLHGLSGRAQGLFVPVNCAALPENLLESELFGYEKGAFTGAGQGKEGLVETASGGTLLLDEIGELPLALQAKLLRVLEDHTFRRVGGTRNISVDLRVIGVTNTDLETAMKERRFRSDLYYRLNVVQIQVPALRERSDDIPELAAHFLAHFNRLYGRSLRGIHPAAQRMLSLYSWPGNIRELRNILERAVLVESSPLVMPDSLALPYRNGNGSGNMTGNGASRDKEPLAARFSLRSGERELIAAALAEANGNQSRTAALLGIGRFSLRYRMKKLGLL